MKHYLLKLKFVTPVHFGSAQGGGQLDKTAATCHADTFFSALVEDLAGRGMLSDVEKLVGKVKAGEVLFSDLFPYHESSAKGDCEFYLPKPFVLPASPKGKTLGLSRMREEAALRKKQKKQAFVRASKLQKFLHCIETGENYDEALPEFGVADLVQKVNCRESEPLPYYVGTFNFAPDAGLYIVYTVNDEQDAEWVEKLVESLGYAGIGGRRSSGYGKFELPEDSIEMSTEGLYADDAFIYAMLTDKKADRQMLLSVLLPEKRDLAIVRNGCYKILQRSGFAVSPVNGQQKRDSVYMLEAGSCFSSRINGKMVSVAGEGMPHEVWRYGIGMYAGLTL